MKKTLWMDCYGSGHGIVSAEWNFGPQETTRGGATCWVIDGGRCRPMTIEDVRSEDRWVESKAEAVKRYRAHATRELNRAQDALKDAP